MLAKEIIKKVPGLSVGNFWYWVRYKCGINPVSEKRKGHQIIDVYSGDCIEIITKKMKEKKTVK